jgi:hypothetical protein
MWPNGHAELPVSRSVSATMSGSMRVLHRRIDHRHDGGVCGRADHRRANGAAFEWPTGARGRRRDNLLGSQLNRLWTLAALVGLGLEGDAHAFGQVLEAGLLERGDVNKDVVAAIVRLNEAEAFLFIEEFDST